MKMLIYIMDMRLAERLKLCLILAEKIGGVNAFERSGTSMRYGARMHPLFTVNRR